MYDTSRLYIHCTISSVAPVVLLYIFIQLSVYWLYYCYKPPWWWSQQWPKHVVKNNSMWLYILICAFVGVTVHTDMCFCWCDCTYWYVHLLVWLYISVCGFVGVTVHIDMCICWCDCTYWYVDLLVCNLCVKYLLLHRHGTCRFRNSLL